MNGSRNCRIYSARFVIAASAKQALGIEPDDPKFAEALARLHG
jgi:hypothetical protein